MFIWCYIGQIRRMSGMRVVTVLVCYAAMAVLAVFNTKYAGPFDIVLKQFGDCENPEKYPAKLTGNKIIRHNRSTFLYNSEVLLPEGLDDNVKMRAKVAVFGNGGWRSNFFVIDLGGVCTVYQNVIPDLKKLLEKHMKYSCPAPPGNYSLKNALLKFKVNWPSFPYNSYRYEVVFTKDGKEYLCKRFFIDVVPKKNGN